MGIIKFIEWRLGKVLVGINMYLRKVLSDYIVIFGSFLVRMLGFMLGFM